MLVKISYFFIFFVVNYISDKQIGLIERIGIIYYVNMPYIYGEIRCKHRSVGGIFMIAKSISLPKQLESFRTALEPSAIEYMKMNISTTAPSLINSKLGGMPYLPEGTIHPRDERVEYMLLLAQVNFSEGLFPSPFPTKGLLQFFISPFAYEQALKTGGILTTHFRVNYYPTLTTENLVTDFTYLQNTSTHLFPLKCEYPLSFSKKVEPVSATDYRLKQFISHELMEQFTHIEHQPFHDVYLQYFSSADMKIGGYPYFISEDIRESNIALRTYDTLLLQIVSDDELDIMWGDSGVLKFFIDSKKLEKLDFSDVLLFTEDY